MNKCISKILKKTKQGKIIYNKLLMKEKIKKYRKLIRTEPINEKQIIFSAFQGRLYACSPKAIYEYMLTAPEFKDFTFIWAFNMPDSKRKFFSDGRTKLVKYNSEEFKKYLASSKYWVFNFKTTEDFVKREEQIFIQCWHGTPLKRLGCDIEIEGNKATKKDDIHQSYIDDAKKYNYFISPSKYCTEKFCSSFGLDKLNKENIIIEKGYPRNEYLFRYTDEMQRKIKKELGIPENKKVIMYAPTFRDNKYTPGVGHTYDLGINLLRLKDKLSSEYVILFRLHYLLAEVLDFSQFKNFVYDVSKYDDVNELYIISDLLITDYSSVFFDYANLKKPVLFYMYDLEEYQNNIRDFYIDICELPGPIVENEKELINNIKNIEEISKDYRKKYEEFRVKYNYLDGKDVTEKVVREFMHNDKKNSY